jgi:hypothetical protein
MKYIREVIPYLLIFSFALILTCLFNGCVSTSKVTHIMSCNGHKCTGAIGIQVCTPEGIEITQLKALAVAAKLCETPTHMLTSIPKWVNTDTLIHPYKCKKKNKGLEYMYLFYGFQCP